MLKITNQEAVRVMQSTCDALDEHNRGCLIGMLAGMLFDELEKRGTPHAGDIMVHVVYDILAKKGIDMVELLTHHAEKMKTP